MPGTLDIRKSAPFIKGDVIYRKGGGGPLEIIAVSGDRAWVQNAIPDGYVGTMCVGQRLIDNIAEYERV
jgi:hypothetical protein